MKLHYSHILIVILALLVTRVAFTKKLDDVSKKLILGVLVILTVLVVFNKGKEGFQNCPNGKKAIDCDNCSCLDNNCVQCETKDGKTIYTNVNKGNITPKCKKCCLKCNNFKNYKLRIEIGDDRYSNSYYLNDDGSDKFKLVKTKDDGSDYYNTYSDDNALFSITNRKTNKNLDWKSGTDSDIINNIITGDAEKSYVSLTSNNSNNYVFNKKANSNKLEIVKNTNNIYSLYYIDNIVIPSNSMETKVYVLKNTSKSTNLKETMGLFLELEESQGPNCNGCSCDDGECVKTIPGLGRVGCDPSWGCSGCEMCGTLKQAENNVSKAQQ